ncbi:anthrone oxygenase family protein [Streptomyces asiaticus]
MPLPLELVQALVIVAAGIVTGTFFAVAVSVFPVLMTMPPRQYVATQRRLGEGYHPVMPIIVSSVLVGDVLLAVFADGGGLRAVYTVAAALFLAVPLISQYGNLPLNKAIQAADRDGVPDDWADPRPGWRRWHLIRSVFAVVALVLNVLAAAIPA